MTGVEHPIERDITTVDTQRGEAMMVPKKDAVRLEQKVYSRSQKLPESLRVRNPTITLVAQSAWHEDEDH